MKLLTVGDAKTVKGQKVGYQTAILYQAPARESGVIDLCIHSSAGCRAGCLYRAGRAAIFPSIIDARIRRTKLYASDRTAFVSQLRREIVPFVASAKRKGFVPCIRLNGTSDLPWLGMKFASEFPEVQFYDYTKHPKAWLRTRANYHITFSLSEDNLPWALDSLHHGISVAVVFNTRRGAPLPTTWRGFDVIDGDVNDLRFLDRKGIIVGLRAKGPARKDTSGFVQITNNNHTGE